MTPGVSGEFCVPAVVFGVLTELCDVGELSLTGGTNLRPVVKLSHCSQMFALGQAFATRLREQLT